MATLRRQVKNMVKNYSEAEVKVREATSNDPWGPSSTLMSEISDLTYNIVALGEIMRMIWKRLNDHGKNWRHVYKSLVLLDYLIKNGNEKVAQQCKEHIVAIQTLKDFQYMEEQRDQGASVREKAKQLVNLLRDDDRLKQERAKAFRARERFAQNAMGISSDNKLTFATSGRLHAGTSTRTQGNYADPYGGSAPEAANNLTPELEAVRPSDTNEEELQIKLALMLSQQEHDEEVQRKRADEAKLHLALEQSKNESQPNGLVDLADMSDPWGDSRANNLAGGGGFKASFPDSDNDDDFFPPSGAKNNDPWGPASSIGVAAAAAATANLPPPANKSNGFGGLSSFPPSQNGFNTNNNNSSVDPWNKKDQTNPWNNTASSDPWTNGNGTTSNGTSKFDDFDLFSNNRISVPSSTTTATSSSSNVTSSNVNKSGTTANDDPFGDFFGGAGTATKASNSTNPWNSNTNGMSTSNTNTNISSTLLPVSTSNSDLANKNAAAIAAAKQAALTRKTPESFLGENASLVNLENLIPSNRPKSTNPFGNTPAVGSTGMTSSTSSGQLNNPFLSQQPKPSINQLQQQQSLQFGAAASNVVQPLIPTSTSASSLPPLAQPLIIPPASTTGTATPIIMPTMQPFMGMTMPGATMQFPAYGAGAAGSSLFPTQALASMQPQQAQPAGASAASTNPFLMM